MSIKYGLQNEDVSAVVYQRFTQESCGGYSPAFLPTLTRGILDFDMSWPSLCRSYYFLMSSTALSTFFPARSMGPSVQHDSMKTKAIMVSRAMILLNIFIDCISF
jgi:hypothetical protein